MRTRRRAPLAPLVAALVLGVILVGVAGTALAATRHPATTSVTRSESLSSVDQAAAKQELTLPKAAVLGVVEGVTEFLPISSTGHLLVTERLLGVGTADGTKDAADDFAIVIQAGAILAVALVFWRRLISVGQGAIGRDAAGRRLLINLVVAFLPAAIIGFLFEKKIKEHLFAPWPIVVAWVVGGLLLLLVSTRDWMARERAGSRIEDVTVRQALIVGAAQCLALWPGTSRSLVTIVAAIFIGLELAAAVEFSFLLGLVTLSAATVYDVAKHGHDMVAIYGVAAPVVGFVFALAAGFVAVRWMLAYLQDHSLAIFGWYRLGVAGLTAALLVTGRI